jgi:hypothetical protein
MYVCTISLLSFNFSPMKGSLFFSTALSFREFLSGIAKCYCFVAPTSIGICRGIDRLVDALLAKKVAAAHLNGADPGDQLELMLQTWESSPNDSNLLNILKTTAQAEGITNLAFYKDFVVENLPLVRRTFAVKELSSLLY